MYGFAGGDPVNFSDPFGLDPCRLSGLNAFDMPVRFVKGTFAQRAERHKSEQVS